MIYNYSKILINTSKRLGIEINSKKTEYIMEVQRHDQEISVMS